MNERFMHSPIQWLALALIAAVSTRVAQPTGDIGAALAGLFALVAAGLWLQQWRTA